MTAKHLSVNSAGQCDACCVPLIRSACLRLPPNERLTERSANLRGRLRTSRNLYVPFAEIRAKGAPHRDKARRKSLGNGFNRDYFFLYHGASVGSSERFSIK